MLIKDKLLFCIFPQQSWKYLGTQAGPITGSIGPITGSIGTLPYIFSFCYILQPTLFICSEFAVSMVVVVGIIVFESVCSLIGTTLIILL